MKKYKAASTAFYLAAVLYIAAAIVFIGGGNTSMAVIWLCLGSANLCLGSVQLNRAKELEKKNKENEA